PSAEAMIVERDASDEFVMSVAVSDAATLAAAQDQLLDRFPGLHLDVAGTLDGTIDGVPVSSLAPDTQLMVYGVLGPSVTIDELRTATDDLRGGQPLVGGTDDVFGDQTFVDDV